MKLKKIGKMINIPKLDSDYDKVNARVKGAKVHFINKEGKPDSVSLKKELAYLERDCQIVYEALNYFRTEYKKNVKEMIDEGILPNYQEQEKYGKMAVYFKKDKISVGSYAKSTLEMFLQKEYGED
jgi:hypothetical protein